jgi:hypothetical protein
MGPDRDLKSKELIAATCFLGTSCTSADVASIEMDIDLVEWDEQSVEDLQEQSELLLMQERDAR